MIGVLAREQCPDNEGRMRIRLRLSNDSACGLVKPMAGATRVQGLT
jgi:hypothetical protein